MDKELKAHRGIWKAMLRRCNSPKHPQYSDYGGRGIKVCERWHKFANFAKDMARPAPSLTLDRINNDGDYEPSNCQWATRAQQAKNRRDNKFLTFNGETLCISEWERKIGFGVGSLAGRIRLGWPVDIAMTKPVQKRTVKGNVAALPEGEHG